jgi:hypothetical protein
MSRGCSTPPVWSAISIATWVCRWPRPRRWPRSASRSGTAVRAFARDHAIPWVDFAKGQRKDDVAQEFLAGFTGTEGVLFIGRAQEKTSIFRTRKRHRDDGSPYPWIAHGGCPEFRGTWAAARV